jgi:hypothetical protein
LEQLIWISGISNHQYLHASRANEIHPLLENRILGFLLSANIQHQRPFERSLGWHLAIDNPVRAPFFLVSDGFVFENIQRLFFFF